MILTREKPLHWAEAFGLSAAVHVGAAYLLLNTVIDLNTVFPMPEPDIPELQITSLAIEAGDLITPEPGTSLADGTTPEALAPVAQSQSAPETVQPVETATPVEVAEPVTPTTPAETLAEVATPVTQDPAPRETLTPVAPVAQSLAPAPVSPLRPQTERLAPVSNAGTEQVARVAPAPVAPTLPAAAATPPPPGDGNDDTTAQAAPSSATAPDPLAADLINRIRSAVGDTCLIAVPQQGADGDIALTIYAADESAVAPFADAILDGLTPRPDQTTVLVDPRQCAALDFARQTAAYPTSPMTIALDAPRIASGEVLTGRLTGTGGRNITLVLVDDNGVTQDLGTYLNIAVSTARFTAPLRRIGVARDTRQLLIAIATNNRPAAVTAQNGQLAADYFGALQAEVGTTAAISLAPFDVR